VVAFAFSLVTSVGAASSPKPTQGVLVLPARFDLAVKPGEMSIARELVVMNTGTAPDTYSIQSTDLVVSNGTTELLPAHSTPYAADVAITPATLALNPKQQGKVTVRFDVSKQPVFFGGLVIASTSAPTPQTTTGVAVLTRTQIVVPFSAAPVDDTGELLPEIHLAIEPAGLRLSGLKVGPLWFQESGPIVATATARNDGDVYERQLAGYEFSAEGRTFLKVDGLTQSAMPGGSASTRTSTVQALEHDGGLIDTSPIFCFCGVRAEIRGSIAERATAPVTESAYVVVLPFRALLIVLAVVLGALWGARRRQRR